MEQEFELFQFEPDSPVKMYGHRGQGAERHWHPELELFLVLRGPVEFICDDRTFTLQDGDILAINSYSVHSYRSAGTISVVSLKMDLQRIGGIDASLRYECNSSEDNDKGRYYNLKRHMAEFAKSNAEPGDNRLLTVSIVYSILYELSSRFRTEQTSAEISSRKYLDRLNSILGYIDSHYKEALTLNELADTQQLSVPYLSSFFEKYLGVNFTTYYNDLRLKRAVNELMESDDSVETIALNNGFTNPRSFVTLFKRKYGTLPSLYRKRPPQKQTVETMYYDDSEPDKEIFLRLLTRYLPSPAEAGGETETAQPDFSDVKYVSKENISAQNVQKTLKHTFKVFTSVGRAKELLFADVQRMLTELQRDIGYEYITFHGLLSDDMLVYREDDDGNPVYSFVYVDNVLDFLQSIGLKPLLQMSFMPRALASDPDKNAFDSPFNTSPPKDYDKWADLVRALTSHIIDRYGYRTVRTWLFTVWNEPDTTEYIFGFKDDDDFYRLYLATYKAIKGVNRNLRVGSPPLLLSYDMMQRWCAKFISWCKENDCMPDFMNMHYYDNDFSEETISLHKPSRPAFNRLNRDEHAFSKWISQVKVFLSGLGCGSLPMYLTEWNLTVSHRNLLNDTCFKSCYMTKNLLENYDELDSFCYWVLTDMIEETQPAKDEFHGGLGLFTRDGIKKPHYYAFDFINRLGDKLIDRDDGYFITKSPNGIQIILYNYEHFNHLFASGEKFDIDYIKQYMPFSQLGRMEISLVLTDISSQECTIREHIINQDSGSAFDEWMSMGAPKALTADDIQYLKHVSVPKYQVYTRTVSDGVLPINASLEPLEVRLIEIEL